MISLRIRRVWCWLSGCKPMLMHKYEHEGIPHSAVLFCWRCERSHGFNY